MAEAKGIMRPHQFNEIKLNFLILSVGRGRINRHDENEPLSCIRAGALILLAVVCCNALVPLPIF